MAVENCLPRTSTDFYYLSLSETQNLDKCHQSDLMRESAYNVLSDTTFFNNQDLSLLIKESKFDASKFYEIFLEKEFLINLIVKIQRDI